MRGVELSTEKRFIANIDSLYPVRISGIQDTVTGKELTVFDEVVDKLNALHEENEQLKQVLGGILIEVRRDISATNHSGEVKAFVNPNSFDLISDVLKKYGALKDWYE